MKKIELPHLPGTVVPEYVKMIAGGDLPKHRAVTAEQPKLRSVQEELLALTVSDAQLIEKYVSLYQQIRALKEETQLHNEQNDKIMRSEEEKKKYAVRRTEVPVMRASRESSRRSLGTDDSLDSSVGSEPDRSLSQRSTMLYLPAKFTVPPPTLPFGLNSLSCAAALNTRNNSVNSIQSSSNSSTLSSTDKPMRESSPDDFDEIAMPQEGELSNLDVDWFMTYDCTLSRPEKPTA
ncbi:unnamed protein product [Oikopleura dioica]|uniref:Uncharacterized protein n=1 Tax=Oikopleura dioica TaxID=34765 RepID=E4WSC0_OIKDI|nr:unnamed protein product [Oikopleura dioica]